MGFSCITEPRKDWFKDVLNSLRQSGSYHTVNHHGGALYVIPKMKIVIFEYFE